MKNAVFYLSCLLLMYCTTSIEQESSLEDRINQVIKEDLYYDYQILQLQFSEKLASNEFNMDEIGLMIKAGNIPSCSVLSNSQSALPDNISSYFLGRCQSKEAFDKLATKYPDIFNGDATQAKKVMETFVKSNEKFRMEQNLFIERQAIKAKQNED